MEDPLDERLSVRVHTCILAESEIPPPVLLGMCVPSDRTLDSSVIHTTIISQSAGFVAIGA